MRRDRNRAEYRLRTTVEITEDQHRALSALAHRRGLRGFSVLVQEALTSYLSGLDSDDIDLLLGLEGLFDETEEAEMRSRIEEAKAEWRSS